MQKQTQLANELWPLLLPKVLRVLTGGTVAVTGGGAGTGGTGVTDHGNLSGLLDDDHPQYLRVDGARALTGSLAVGAGVTIDGVDLSAHASDPDAHHARQHGIISSADHTVTGAQWQVVGLTGTNTLGLLGAGDGLEGVGSGWRVKREADSGLTIGGANGLTLGAPLPASISSANSVAGTQHSHAVTSSTDPDASASLLATTGAGLLTLRNLAMRQAAQSYATFASGFAGSGWRVDYGITTANRASAEFDELTVRGRMRIYELLIQQIRATNGSLFVTSGSKVVAVTAVSNAWTVNGAALTFNGSAATFSASFYTINTAAAGDSDRSLYHGFLYGDLPAAQQTQWNGSAFAGVMVSKIEVTRVDSLTQYGAALVEGDAPAVGFDYVRRGNTVDPTRRGAIYLTSDDNAAPFIDIIDGLASHSDWGSAALKRTRLGKLTGISDVDFGGPLSGYGIYTDNGYFKGKIIVTGGNAATTGYVDTGLAGRVPTAGAAADINANTTTIDGGRITALSVTAAQIAAGTILGDKLALTSYLAINSATYGADGVQMQYNAGNPRAYIGNGSNRFFQFDGSNISWQGTNTSLTAGGTFTASDAVIEGDIVADSGYIGGVTGWLISAGLISSGTVGLYSGPALTARLQVGPYAGISSAAGSGDIVFWAGNTHALRNSAAFKVDASGMVTASNMILTGSLNISGTGAFISGSLYAGGVSPSTRLSTDGQRFVLPNVTGIDVPTSSSALRWFPAIDGTHDYTKNYTGLVGYRHTGATAVDMLHTAFVGSTDAATYDARLILQAGHQTGSDAATTYTSSMLIITREKGAGLKTVNAICDVFTTSAAAYIGGALRVLAQSVSPPIGGNAEGVNIYNKGDKLIFAYNEGGTVRYKYITMSGAGLGWSYSATEP